MKKTFFFLIAFIIALTAGAQDKLNPAIKKGTRLNYVAHTNDGRDLPFTITFDSATADYVKLNWAIEGMGSGAWIMKKNSLDKAVNFFGKIRLQAPMLNCPTIK